MNLYLPMRSSCLAMVAGIFMLTPWIADAVSLERNYDTNTGQLTLVATPDAGTSVYAVEEQLPDGLSARFVSNEGCYDRFLNKLKWGPFFDDQPRTLTCELVTVADTQVTFSGRVSSDGSPGQSATGVNSGQVRASGFPSWILAELGQAAFFEPVSSATDDSDRDQAELLEEYVFGMDPSLPDKHFLELIFYPNAGRVELNLRKRGELGNVRLSFWESTDLVSWSPFDPGAAEVLEEFEDGLQMVRWTWTGGASRNFVQLRLTIDEAGN